MTLDRLRQIVALRLRSLFSGSSVDRELDEELRFHIDRQIEAHTAAGMAPEAARTAATRALGGIEQRKEECRDMRGLGPYERSVADTRYALRVLKRSPAFALVAIASLAFGMAAFLAMFQLIDAVRLRALAVEDAQELVDVRIDGGRGGWGLSDTAAEMTLPLWREIRANQSVLTDMFAWGRSGFLMGDGGGAVPVRGLYFSGEAFSALRLRPVVGRLLSPADDQPGCQGAVVLSHAFWQARFGGDHAVLGMPITLLQQRFTIVGVAPPQFTGLEVGRSFDLALPICAAARIGPSYQRRDFWWLSVMGRLSNGGSLAQAAAHFRALSPGLFEATLPTGYSGESLDKYRSFRLTAVAGSHGVSRLRMAYESPLWLLLGTTALILLLTVANLATLMLARGHTRRREMAMRVALGASRRRLIAQIVIESLLLSGAGVALALPLAIGAGRALLIMLSTDLDPLYVPLAIDGRAAAVATISIMSTALLFGLLPAFQSMRFDLLIVLRSGGRAHTMDRHRAVFQRGLVVAQLAICFVLVVSAMLFMRSLQNIAAVDIGFNPDDLKIVGFVDPDMNRLPIAQQRIFQSGLITAIESIPGVESAGAASQIPLSGASWNQSFYLADGPRPRSAKFTYVSPGFFRVMQISIRSGRGFEPSDTAASRRVAIVNDAFVRQFLGSPSDAPIAIRTRMEANYPATVYEVVGQAGNIKYGDVREDDLPIVYIPLDQAPVFSTWKSIIVRTGLPASAIHEAARSRLAKLNPDIWVRVSDFPAQLNQRLVRERMLAWLAGIFGILAVSIAAVGLYGLMTYLALGRRSEIGIRLALGATRWDVLAMMLRELIWLVGAGLVLGVASSVPLSGTASRLLFQLPSTDAVTWAGAALTLLIVAGVASIVPAWRTAGLDPLLTLRAEQS